MAVPMHYPPLANGAYRYGEEPRPLPSPIPGPDPDWDPFPSHQAGSPGVAPGAGTPASAALGAGAAGSASPGTVPSSGVPTGRDRPRGAVAAASIVGGLALVVVAVLTYLFVGAGGDPGRSPTDPLVQGDPWAASEDGSPTFTVRGVFTVVAAPGEPVSGTGTGCELPVSLSDIGEGTTLTLLEVDTGRTTDSMLAYDGGDLSSCTFTFSFPDVTADGSLYLIELPGRGQLTYSENELRAGVEISLGR